MDADVPKKDDRAARYHWLRQRWIDFQEKEERHVKINGWTLTIATAHGVRMWHHESGKVEIRGIDGLSSKQLEEFIKWGQASMAAKEFLPVPDWPVSDADIADLLEMDADELLAVTG